MKGFVIVLALSEAGFMAFDGTRALMAGDYITIGGQLGPWAILVSGIGIEPRSFLMKSIFAVYGFLWLGLTAAFIRQSSWSRTLMLIAAMGALWYLPIGTLFSIIQILLLTRK